MTSDPIARYLSQRTSRLDRRARLRIMTSSEVIDTAVKTYQVLGWTFLKLTVIPSLLCLAATSFFFRYVLPNYLVTRHVESESGQLIEMAITTGLALFVAVPLFIMGYSATSAIVTKLVSEFMVGEVPSAAGAAETNRKLLPKLILLNVRETFLTGAGALAALLLLALGGHLGTVTSETDVTAGLIFLLACLAFGIAGGVFLWVVTRHALASASLVLEGTTVRQAVKRSSYLMRRDRTHGSGAATIWLLYMLLAMLFPLLEFGLGGSLKAIGFPENVQGWISAIPYSDVGIEALSLLPTFVVIWTLLPLWAATTTILYYDRRIRLEGYDIEALAEDVWRADKSHRFDL